MTFKSLQLILIQLLFTQIIFANMEGILQFTDSSDNEVLSYPAGDPLYVHLEDSDRNADTGASETVTVTVLSATEDGGESLTLTETG